MAPTRKINSEAHVFPILSLPFELRLRIYGELLEPSSGQIYTLFHDTNGREPAPNISTTLLRANKQIYAEAYPFLYSRNTLKIDLTTPLFRKCMKGHRGTIPVPPRLFRRIAPPASGVMTTGGLQNAHRTAQEGVIHPQALRRLRHREIDTSMWGVWGEASFGREGMDFSKTGELILEILRTLSGDDDAGNVCSEPSATKKTLKFSVLPGKRSRHLFWDLDENWTGWYGGDRSLWENKMEEMKGLLDEVGKVRKVEILDVGEFCSRTEWHAKQAKNE